MESLQEHITPLIRYTSLHEIYVKYCANLELKLYTNCLYRLFMLLKHPRYILDLAVVITGQSRPIPLNIIRDFYLLGLEIEFKHCTIPSDHVVHAPELFWMEKYVTANNIFKEWFAYYLFNSNILPCLNPVEVSHVLHFSFVKDMHSFQEYKIDGLCKFCIQILCTLNGWTNLLREIKHSTTINRYPFQSLQDKSKWCLLCKRTPMFCVMAPTDCVLEYGAGAHKCRCPVDRCLHVNNDWVRYDVPDLSTFHRRMERQIPYSLRARRRLDFNLL